MTVKDIQHRTAGRYEACQTKEIRAEQSMQLVELHVAVRQYGRAPLPLEAVEPASEIVKRFRTGPLTCLGHQIKSPLGP